MSSLVKQVLYLVLHKVSTQDYDEAKVYKFHDDVDDT